MASRYRSTCFVDGCEFAPAARGFCRGHYQQLRRHGRIIGLIRTRSPRTVASDAV